MLLINYIKYFNIDFLTIKGWKLNMEIVGSNQSTLRRNIEVFLFHILPFSMIFSTSETRIFPSSEVVDQNFSMVAGYWR